MFPPERLAQGAFAVALLFGGLQCAFPTSAAGGPAICAMGAGPRSPVPVPKNLEADVARTFSVPVNLVRGGAFVRCAGAKLLACVVGANLNCGQASTHPSLPGTSEFCRANPDAQIVPRAATGHDTIYVWRCVGRRAVAAKAVVAVDRDGYDAGNWWEVNQ